MGISARGISGGIKSLKQTLYYKGKYNQRKGKQMEKPNQDGWYTYQTKDHTQGFFGQLALEIETLEKHEQQHYMLLKSLVETLLVTRPTYDYYFSECYDTPTPADMPRQSGSEWQTLYDNSPLYGKPYWPYAYDTIYVADSYGDYVYFALCRNGCSHSSALAEYIRVNTVAAPT